MRKNVKNWGVESRLVAMTLIQRGMLAEDLDTLCGFCRNTVTNAIAQNFPNRLTRFKVESALEMPIWSDTREMNLRLACKRRFGFDPRLLTKPMAAEWVKKLELPANTKSSLAELVNLLLDYFAANPTKKEKQNVG